MKKSIVDGGLILKLENDLTASNVRKIEQSIRSYIFDTGEQFRNVAIDMQEVKNIDSIGISFVIIIYKLASKKGKGFKISNMNDNIKSIFKLMKLEELIGEEKAKTE